MLLTNEEKQILLKAARNSIRKYLGIQEVNDGYIKTPNLIKEMGAFVTINEENELRGCIGYIESNTPLYQTVKDAAKQAAFNDPRFIPIRKEEYELLRIEISVLYAPYPLNSYDDIIIGKHGLIINEPGHRGLLLPQVATEYNFDVPMYLSALCEKAGLYHNEWRKREIKLMAFECEVFSEND